MDEFEDWDEDENKEPFQTRDERKRERNAKYQREFRKRHKTKLFVAEFKEGEGLSEILARLKQDGITNKEFVARSFEQYKKDGGFRGD